MINEFGLWHKKMAWLWIKIKRKKEIFLPFWRLIDYFFSFLAILVIFSPVLLQVAVIFWIYKPVIKGDEEKKVCTWIMMMMMMMKTVVIAADTDTDVDREIEKFEINPLIDRSIDWLIIVWIFFPIQMINMFIWGTKNLGMGGESYKIWIHPI